MGKKKGKNGRQNGHAEDVRSVFSDNSYDTAELAGEDRDRIVHHDYLIENFNSPIADNSDSEFGDAHVAVSTEALRDDIGNAIDQLSEKRSRTKEQALRQLIETLRQYPPGLVSVLGPYGEMVSEFVVACLKRGGNETVLAADFLSLYCVVMPADDCKPLWQRASKLLRMAASSPDLSTSSKRSTDLTPTIAATRTLAIGCYVFSRDEDGDEVTDSLLEFFAEMVENAHFPDELRAAALDAWSLLATVLSSRQLHSASARVLPFISTQLQSLQAGSDEVAQLLSMCGETAALLHQTRMELQEELEEQGESLSEVVQDEDALWASIFESFTMRSKESTKRLGKHMKKEQHATFREFVGFVERGDEVARSVTFGDNSMDVTTWVGIKHLSAFRSVLKGGLAAHLSANPLLRLVFNQFLDEEEEEPDWAKSTKQRNQNRNRDRDDKQTRAMHLDD